MSHTHYDIPQGEVGRNNHFGSLVNVVDNSAEGNTLYDNILAWASPSEMSQLWLEPGGLPTVCRFSTESAQNQLCKQILWLNIIHLVMHVFFFKWQQQIISEVIVFIWAFCLLGPLVWPSCCTAEVKRFVPERLCQQSAGHSHSLACSHHSQ